MPVDDPSPPGSAWTSTPAERHERVAIVLARRERRASLRSSLSDCAVGWRICMVSSAHEAAFRLVSSPVRLLVLDLRVCPDQPLALIHLLARCAPTAHLLAFADGGAADSIAPYVARAWSTQDRALVDAVRAVESLSVRAVTGTEERA